MSPPDTTTLLADVRALLHAAARQVNALLVLTNYEIDRRIVEHEQGCEARAEYGAGALQSLSAHLNGEIGRGCSVGNLTLMRSFYLAYPDRVPISETPSRISASPTPPVRNVDALPPEAARLATPARPFTLPPGANIHAREYTLALPSAEEPRRRLLEWTEAP